MRAAGSQATTGQIARAARLHADAAEKAEQAEFIAGLDKSDLLYWRTQLDRRKRRLDQAFLLHNAVVAKERMAEAAVGWAIAAIAIGLSEARRAGGKVPRKRKGGRKK